MASKETMTALLAALVGLILGLGQAAAQQRAKPLYTVGNVEVRAEAENSVEAKTIAQGLAQARAFRQLLFRLTDFRAHNRLPELSPQQVAEFVSDMGVRSEGVSPTSYVATFDVSFSEPAVRRLLGQQGFTTIEDRAPEITVLPVYVESGAARTTDRNPWRRALGALDLAHAHVPAKLAPTRGDISAAIAKAYVASPAASLQTLKGQYKTSQVMMAVAELEGGREAITVHVIGSDTLGNFAFKRRFKARDGVDESLMATAARVVFEAVQERFKLTRLSAGVAGAAAVSSLPAEGYGSTPSAYGNEAGYSAGGSDVVLVTAEYSGLSEWKTIRTRMQNVPGVHNWELKEVTPRSATITFSFPGGGERWRQIAATQGLFIEPRADGFVVKTR